MSNSLSFMLSAFRVESARCCITGSVGGHRCVHGLEIRA